MFKKIFKFILQYYLKIIAQICLFTNSPVIIAIAGSANKSFFKYKIYNRLIDSGYSAQQTDNNFNTEIGLPLSILDLPSGYNSYKQWIPIIIKAFKKIFSSKFPQFLILEVGVSEPGDMKYLLSIIKPKISIITDITKRYLGAFGEITKLIDEYKELLKHTNPKGLLILNYDNDQVKSLQPFFSGQIKFFGMENGSDFMAKNIIEDINGQKFIIQNFNSSNEIIIKERGLHHVYATIASIIVQEYVSQIKKN